MPSPSHTLPALPESSQSGHRSGITKTPGLTGFPRGPNLYDADKAAERLSSAATGGHI